MKNFKNKILSFALAGTLVLGCAPTAFAADSLIGDANGDAKVTSADALLILQYSVGQKVEGLIKENADLNADGNINSADALAVLKICVGMTETDPQNYTKDQLVKYYNDALLKTEKGNVNVKNHYVISGTMSDPNDSSSVTPYNDEYKYEADFVDGYTQTEKEEDSESIFQYIPYAGLESAGVASMSIVKNGDGYTITIKLVSEKATLEEPPHYNGECAFYYNYYSEKTETSEVTAADITYSGTTIIVDIDAQGRIYQFNMTIPYGGIVSVKDTEYGEYLYIDSCILKYSAAITY